MIKGINSSGGQSPSTNTDTTNVNKNDDIHAKGKVNAVNKVSATQRNESHASRVNHDFSMMNYDMESGVSLMS